MREQLYVRFLYPGTFFSESSTKAVDSDDVGDLYPLPSRAFGFRFEKRWEGEDPTGRPMTGDFEKVGPFHYIDGEIFTIDELPEDSSYDILRSNMRGNGYERVIKCRTGNFQPFDEGDVQVPSEAPEVTREALLVE